LICDQLIGAAALPSSCFRGAATQVSDRCIVLRDAVVGIGLQPTVLPLSIGDGEMCSRALTTVSVPEIFRYWLQGGHVSIGFLSGAQVDRFGNLNSTVIGSYARPL
jgi:glutaconate CoA-transferase subunit B